MTLRHWINKHHTCTRYRMESMTTSSPQNRMPAAIPVVPLEELPAPSEYMTKLLQKHQEFLAEQKTPEADEMIAQMWRRDPAMQDQEIKAAARSSLHQPFRRSRKAATANTTILPLNVGNLKRRRENPGEEKTTSPDGVPAATPVPQDRIKRKKSKAPLLKEDTSVTSSHRGEDRTCALCGEDDSELGGLIRVRGSRSVVHRFCALYSPGCYEGANGEICNVEEEIKRGKRLKCSECKKTGATIGCDNKRCRKSFHLKCSGSAGCWLHHWKLHCEKHGNYCKEKKESGCFEDARNDFTEECKRPTQASQFLKWVKARTRSEPATPVGEGEETEEDEPVGIETSPEPEYSSSSTEEDEPVGIEASPEPEHSSSSTEEDEPVGIEASLEPEHSSSSGSSNGNGMASTSKTNSNAATDSNTTDNKQDNDTPKRHATVRTATPVLKEDVNRVSAASQLGKAASKGLATVLPAHPKRNKASKKHKKREHRKRQKKSKKTNKTAKLGNGMASTSKTSNPTHNKQDNASLTGSQELKDLENPAKRARVDQSALHQPDHPSEDQMEHHITPHAQPEDDHASKEIKLLQMEAAKKRPPKPSPSSGKQSVPKMQAPQQQQMQQQRMQQQSPGRTLTLQTAPAARSRSGDDAPGSCVSSTEQRTSQGEVVPQAAALHRQKQQQQQQLHTQHIKWIRSQGNQRSTHTQRARMLQHSPGKQGVMPNVAQGGRPANPKQAAMNQRMHAPPPPQHQHQQQQHRQQPQQQQSPHQSLHSFQPTVAVAAAQPPHANVNPIYRREAQHRPDLHHQQQRHMQQQPGDSLHATPQQQQQQQQQQQNQQQQQRFVAHHFASGSRLHQQFLHPNVSGIPVSEPVIGVVNHQAVDFKSMHRNTMLNALRQCNGNVVQAFNLLSSRLCEQRTRQIQQRVVILVDGVVNHQARDFFMDSMRRDVRPYFLRRCNNDVKQALNHLSSVLCKERIQIQQMVNSARAI